MKIITNEAVYVQMNDLGFLYHTNLAIPSSVFNKVFVGDGIFIINDSNRYDFVKFDVEDDIKFFKDLDWIVDYSSLKDLDESQIIELLKETAEKQNDIAQKYNSMNDEERIKNEDMFDESEKLVFKYNSLMYVGWLKQEGIECFDLPDGLEYPNSCEKSLKKASHKKQKKSKKTNK